MARKINISQTAQAVRGFAGNSNRQTTLFAAAINLLQRPSHAEKITVHRRRLEITVDDPTQTEIPQSVKITHAG